MTIPKQEERRKKQTDAKIVIGMKTAFADVLKHGVLLYRTADAPTLPQKKSRNKVNKVPPVLRGRQMGAEENISR